MYREFKKRVRWTSYKIYKIFKNYLIIKAREFTILGGMGISWIAISIVVSRYYMS